MRYALKEKKLHVRKLIKSMAKKREPMTILSYAKLSGVSYPTLKTWLAKHESGTLDG